MSSAPDPLAGLKANPSIKHVSQKSFVISGILITVYGLEELHTHVKDISSIYLLHPRLSNQQRMSPLADITLCQWNKSPQSRSQRGLIAVAFDQRNHGSRLVDRLANEAWITGNPRHAPDMFSTYAGTAADVSLLITYLPAYLFPNGQRAIVSNMVLGISLGGHSGWHCILHDPRIDTAVITIGCADYCRLMSHRAEKSKRQSWTSSKLPGAEFFGSADFPRCLMDEVCRYDPARLFDVDGSWREADPDKRRSLLPLMEKHLQHKKIYCQFGAKDKLVPFGCSEPFLRWLQHAVAPGGWFDGHNVLLKPEVFEGVGHAMTPEMVDQAVSFLVRSLDNATGRQSSKM